MNPNISISPAPDDKQFLEGVKEQQIISEEEFGRILESFANPLLSLGRHVQQAIKKQNRQLHHMGFLANVIKHSSDVEHLLDQHRAGYNLNWVYFREITATLKNFGKAAFLLEELIKNTRPATLFPQQEIKFTDHTDETARFFNGILNRCFLELQQEAKRLKLHVPQKRPLSTYGVKLSGEATLPHTIDESADEDIVHTAKKICSRYVELADRVNVLNEVPETKESMLASQIPEKVNEGKLRQFGTELHNLQSWYDTYVSNHRIEGEFPVLKGLREIFSIQINLFKIATILSHYYERHLFIPTPMAVRLEKIVPSPQLLDVIFNFTVNYQLKIFKTGRKLAASLLDALVETVTYELPVPRDLGFHARPSARVAKVVDHYGAEVKMLVADQSFDAGSILEMLSAGGYILTKRLDHVHFRGDKRALDDLKLLAEYNYGETRDGQDNPLPKALEYLN